METRKSLVVALGNPLAGPDAFGAAVLARVRATCNVGDAADLLDAHTDLLGQIDSLIRHQRVILIDAVVGVEPAGRVAVYDEEQFAGWSESASSCHQISPLVVVKLLRRLYPGATPEIMLVGWAVDEVSRSMGVPDVAVEAGARLVAGLLFDPARTRHGGRTTSPRTSCAEAGGIGGDAGAPGAEEGRLSGEDPAIASDTGGPRGDR